VEEPLLRDVDDPLVRDDPHVQVVIEPRYEEEEPPYQRVGREEERDQGVPRTRSVDEDICSQANEHPGRHGNQCQEEVDECNAERDEAMAVEHEHHALAGEHVGECRLDVHGVNGERMLTEGNSTLGAPIARLADQSTSRKLTAVPTKTATEKTTKKRLEIIAGRLT